jgi:hypothetical protein
MKSILLCNSRANALRVYAPETLRLLEEIAGLDKEI